MSKRRTETTPPKPTAGEAARGLKVTATVDSFWRGGKNFGREASVVSLADLTPEQAEAIRDEPMLVVEDVEIEAPKA